ncbi:MAG: hypothetical protein HC882_07210, partial [Acidobacteria bacterium]|nr:hypothetical protein [Acidobacteriota bacterium]
LLNVLGELYGIVGQQESDRHAVRTARAIFHRSLALQPEQPDVKTALAMIDEARQPARILDEDRLQALVRVDVPEDRRAAGHHMDEVFEFAVVDRERAKPVGGLAQAENEVLRVEGNDRVVCRGHGVWGLPPDSLRHRFLLNSFGLSAISATSRWPSARLPDFERRRRASTDVFLDSPKRQS